MADINRDLDEHVQMRSRKYAFDFEHGKPLNSPGASFSWVKVPEISNSEVSGKKPAMHVHYDRHSTTTTLHSIQADPRSTRGFNLYCGTNDSFVRR